MSAAIALALATSALALDSAVAYRVVTALARASTVALRSPLSPMVEEQDVTEDEAGDGSMAAGGGDVGAAAVGEVERGGEDRRDRDTTLSKTLNPRVA